MQRQLWLKFQHAPTFLRNAGAATAIALVFATCRQARTASELRCVAPVEDLEPYSVEPGHTRFRGEPEVAVAGLDEVRGECETDTVLRAPDVELVPAERE